MYKKMTLLWFILGLGYKLQIVASLSITEIIVLVAAPFIFLRDYKMMKVDGIMPFFALSIMVVVGCVVASIANKTEFMYVVRGLATTCLISCSIIFSHWMLRRDPAGFKWFVLGSAISLILSTFIFKQSVEVAIYGSSSEDIMSGPTFWIARIGQLVIAPIKGWYLHTPVTVSLVIPLALALFSMVTTVSGRSAALGAIGFSALVLIGGKSRRTMNRISRHFWRLCICGGVVICAFYLTYKVSASQGWLGEAAQKKYEAQTAGGTGGVGRLLISGRAESFIGLLACRDKPIIGWGPWAEDVNEYWVEFIMKYGTLDDVINHQRRIARLIMSGQNLEIRKLEFHSYITEFWAWFGISGLVFWLYVIFALMRYLKQDVAAVPQWFAWLACSIPGMLWAIFFSPFAERFGFPLLVVASLMARAVRLGRYQLPLAMIEETEKMHRR